MHVYLYLYNAIEKEEDKCIKTNLISKVNPMLHTMRTQKVKLYDKLLSFTHALRVYTNVHKYQPRGDEDIKLKVYVLLC